MGRIPMEASQPTDDGEALRTLAHLSSLVGHHLINALAAVVSSAENLRMSGGMAAPSDRSDLTELISQVSIDAAAVARRLIGFSRGLTNPDRACANLHELVREACEEARLQAADPIEFRYGLDALAPLTASEADLRWMVRAIATNAVESFDGRGGVVEVGTRTDERGWCFVSIRDEGAGMDAATCERAFDPFFTTKPGREGIGLSVALSIWRRHRGSLRIQSEPGRGTLVELMRPPESPATRGRDPA